MRDRVGRGGMSEVYRAWDATLNREVAVKVLRAGTATRDDFLREARAAAAISHPHITQIHLVEETAGQQYLVMELLRGQTLRESIESTGPLAEETALQIGLDVAEALRAAYRAQMIHGDIKPANIFLTADQGAKVLDFGLAKLANVEVAAEGEVWGSPHYLSPERAGRRAEDFRSDVYSLGATLFHALTGHPPFEAGTPEELALKRLQEKAPGVRTIRPELTPETEQVIDKMLNKSPLLRYRDYDAVIAHLQTAKTAATARRLGLTVTATADKTARRAKLRQGIVVGAGVLVLLVVVGVVFGPRWLSDTRRVEFTCLAPQAQAVFLAGEFNNWNTAATPMKKDSAGKWRITIRLPPGQHPYKYVVDGKWQADPANPDRVKDGFDGYNSLKTVHE